MVEEPSGHLALGPQAADNRGPPTHEAQVGEHVVLGIGGRLFEPGAPDGQILGVVGGAQGPAQRSGGDAALKDRGIFGALVCTGRGF